MHFIYLTLSLLSSLSIAIMMRTFEHKGGNRNVIIASNYIVAGTLAYILSDKTSSDPAIYYFGALLGLFFFIAFVVYSRAIKREGIASAVTMGRLSLAIPVSFSIFLWGETPFLADIISLLVIFLIIITWEGKIGKPSPILLTLFLLFGFIDAGVKYFKIQFPNTDDSFFLIIVFFSGMIWSWGYVLFSRQKIQQVNVLQGLLLGIPNYLSTYFLLIALEAIPAYITFPFINVGTIILSALIGYFLYKEKVNKKRWLLIALGIIAVLFLAT